ncbi:uncharacterized protein LOC141855041 [Brevipalpus obovatus]|uniref:uncharacterized protein LOC141855041 n=1 Tax=Brevipalpus obovatus TaxID=246614 RepID=UPI003D9DF4EA
MLLIATFSVLFCFVLADPIPDAAQCQMQLNDIDSILKEIMMITENPILPSNPEKMEKWCNKTKPLGRKVSKYAPCQEAYPKQVTQLFSTTIKKPVEYVCTTKRDESMAHFACIDDSLLAKFKATASKMLFSMSKLSAVAVPDIVPTICCSFADSLESVKQFPKPTQGNCGTMEVVTWMHDRLKSSADEVLDLVCGDLQTVAKCKSDKPKILESVRAPVPATFSSQATPFLGNYLAALGRMSSN